MGKPCWIIVPKIEVMARIRNKDIVSLTEERSLYIFYMPPELYTCYQIEGFGYHSLKTVSNR